MKTKLTKAEKLELVPKIEAVLKTGEMWEDKSLHYPAGAIIDAVASISGVEKADDRFDTNGWEWDWWQRFTHGGKDYTLSGSGYYGGHSFSLSDE